MDEVAADAGENDVKRQIVLIKCICIDVLLEVSLFVISPEYFPNYS